MSGFSDLAKKLQNYEDVPVRTAESAAKIIEKAIDDEFAQGKSPDGVPWKPLKKGGPSRLEETGAMRKSLSVTAEGTNVNITFSDPKVGFHQKSRPILSSGKLPATWAKAVEDSFSEEFKK